VELIPISFRNERSDFIAYRQLGHAVNVAETADALRLES
jgi:hypothetical protein